MDEKDQKIADLEKQIDALRHRLAQANQKIFSLQKEVHKQYRFTQDYVPYPDEEDR